MRNTWNGLNPATKVENSKKKYNRKRDKKCAEFLANKQMDSAFLCLCHILTRGKLS